MKRHTLKKIHNKIIMHEYFGYWKDPSSIPNNTTSPEKKLGDVAAKPKKK